MDRRKFLQGTVGALGAGMLGLPTIALADDNRFWLRDRKLSIYRPASGERQNVTFFKDGRYSQDGYRRLCWLFRDVVDGNAVIAMNISLFNLLFAQQQYLRDIGRSNPLLVLHSGYRTRRHNNTLEGAAKNSRHLVGDAADFHFQQATLEEVLALARRFRVGGIGTYSTFVHNDIGRYREWRG